MHSSSRSSLYGFINTAAVGVIESQRVGDGISHISAVTNIR